MFQSMVTIHGWIEKFRENLIKEQGKLSKPTEQMISQLKELMEAFDQACMVTVTDNTGKILDVNDAYCDISGYNRKELIGSSYSLLKYNNYTKLFYKDMWKTMIKGEVWTGEMKDLTKQGAEYWVKATFFPVRSDEGIIDKVISVLTDITSCKKEEDERQSVIEEDYPTLMKNLHHFVLRTTFTAETEPVVTLLEGKLAEEIGIDNENVKGRIVTEILGDQEEKTLIKQQFQKAFLGEGVKFDFKQGKRYLQAALSPIKDENSVHNHVFASVSDITELKKSELTVRNMAYQDILTGLPNRRLLEGDLVDCLNKAKRNNKRVGLVLFDLDQFKNINDTLGHSAGDRFIMMIAERMQHLKSQSFESYKLYHLGGDEFIWLLYDITEIGLLTIVQEVLGILEEPFQYKDGDFNLRGSLGISIYPNSAVNAEELMKHADLALFAAKKAGGQSYRFFSSDMKGTFLSQVQLENELRQAVKAEDQFELYYQPIIQGESRKVVSCEALIRWRHPEKGMVSPLQFIRIAEHTGLILPIGEWVIRQTCRDLKCWDNFGANQINVSINISAYQLQQSDFVRRIKHIVDTEEVDPGRLQLEITENSLMENTTDSIRTLYKLRDIGFTLAIDDFGTGYSSLSYLKQFPVHCLKVDQSFIKDLPGDQADRAIVSSTIKLGKDLGLQMIAEGVEIERAYHYLQSVDCPFMQGYYFDKPLPSDKFLEKYIHCQTEVKPVK
ncbi:EAL domain-containing protein [Bacillus shivajii]|uniref:sensor domain-containing protein n=1 Tax=Bacillus shivajii TaxID=1983719 RepID=UPI001CF93A63|nr:EAL domain-containing protein [Bacillus shivajii]UCZ52237.1 EAL domain-containing protein [Bacillus shivajii]